MEDRRFHHQNQCQPAGQIAAHSPYLRAQNGLLSATLPSRGGAELASSTAFASCWTPAAVSSTALRRLRASSRANSEASFARFERVDRHQEIPAPMTVITAQIALIQLGISISISTSGFLHIGISIATSLVAPPPYPSSFICGRFSASQSVRVKAFARELSLRDIHMSD